MAKATHPMTMRTVTAGDLEWRADSAGVTFEGHASTFNQAYDMGWYRETVAPGAFKKTLQEKPDVRFLINHEGMPLARTSSKTLDLAEDDSGLYVRSILDPSDPDVQRLIPKMRRGDLNEMSFAFGLVKDEWTEDYSERTLRELSLANGDVSIVTYPANPNAKMAMRMVENFGQERLREFYAEVRAGAKFSGDTQTALRSILESLAIADENLDASLVDLSTLIGVENPDMDAVAEDAGRAAAEAEALEAQTVAVARELRKARIRAELMKH